MRQDFMPSPQASRPRTLADLVFLGFNSRLAAVDRADGEIVWQWVSPKGSGYVAMLLEADTLFASVGGYLYALDPLTGELRWTNPMAGMGTGTPSLVSLNGIVGGTGGAAHQIAADEAAAAGAT